MNKYLVSVDIEGITGVSSKLFADNTGRNYEQAKRYMVHDTNAVIEGILAADQEAQIIVRDAHGNATNLDLEKLHPKAQLLQGWGDYLSMITGINETFRGVLLVGYHAGGNSNDAVLAHTWSSFINYVKINDRIVNEAGLTALHAGHYNVPILFISGDNYTIWETGKLFPNIIGVIVKESYGRDAALSLALPQAQKLLTTGATQAIYSLEQKLPQTQAWKLPTPIRAEIKLFNRGYSTSIFQKVYRLLEFDKSYSFIDNDCIIQYQADSQLEFLQKLNLLASLVYSFKAGT